MFLAPHQRVRHRRPTIRLLLRQNRMIPARCPTRNHYHHQFNKCRIGQMSSRTRCIVQFRFVTQSHWRTFLSTVRPCHPFCVSFLRRRRRRRLSLSVSGHLSLLDYYRRLGSLQHQSSFSQPTAEHEGHPSGILHPPSNGTQGIIRPKIAR